MSMKMNERHATQKLAVRPALEQVPSWLRKRSESGHLLLALDFDGTIAPLVRKPEEAQMLPAARPALERLLNRADTDVAFISGRALADLRARCSFDNAFYAGNHGIEIGGPGVHHVRPEALEHRPAVRKFAEQLQRELARFKGVTLEDKDLTLSVHYREVDDEHQQQEIVACVEQLFADSNTEGLKLTYGKRVVEVRPSVNWDKGKALLYVIDCIERDRGVDLFPIFAGDDVTDEDGFRVLQGYGAGVLVARDPARETAATSYVCSIEEMIALLEALA